MRNSAPRQSSHGDVDPYHGWVIGYNATNLSHVAISNISADGERGGIWMGGAAPAADSADAIYLSTGTQPCCLSRYTPSGLPLWAR
jgi:hypothetical protein